MRRLELAAALVFTCAAIAATQPRAAGADTLTVRAFSGQAYEGFIGNPGDTHVFLLEDFAPQLVTISLKASRGSALVPDITLADPALADVTSDLDPVRTDTARSVTVKNTDAITEFGAYALRVGGKDGTTGGYLLKVTAKVVKKFTGSGLVASAGGNDDFTFFAPKEALVSLKVVPAAGSTILPAYVFAQGAACEDPRIAIGTRPGTATFVSLFSFDHTVRIEGDAGTGGPFNWTAKIKAAKPSRKPARVNGGAAAPPLPGPAPAKFTEKPGQEVHGFDADGTILCWREVRVSGGGPNVGKNSISACTLTGGNLPAIANSYATDAAPPDRTFALGPTHAVAVTNDDLHALPRAGGMEILLDGTVGTIDRILADESAAYVLDSSGIVAYPFAGGGPLPRSSGSGTYLDMAFGGQGIVYVVESGGNLEVHEVTRSGSGDRLVADLGTDPGLRALASRGPDAYVALDNGAGGTDVYFVSCLDDSSRLLTSLLDAPVPAMAVDELNLYFLEDDATDGLRIRQISRGGGEASVIARGDAPGGFTYLPAGLAASKGWVHALADDGTPAFYRVKRR